MPRIGQYTQDKNKALPEWETWKSDPSEENLGALLKTQEPIIKSALRSFGGDDPKLKTRAKILAKQALEDYDPAKGAALNTHLHHRLQRLHRYRAERSSAIHIPENTRLDAFAIKKFNEQYVTDHGIDPSDEHVSDSLEMSMKRIGRARGIGEASGSQLTSEKGDLVSEERDYSKIWAEYVYHDLGEKDKKIYEWVTGHNGNKRLPKAEIAKRLGISAAAVSQRVGRIANKIQEGLK